jgi:hypothetical protein
MYHYFGKKKKQIAMLALSIQEAFTTPIEATTDDSDVISIADVRNNMRLRVYADDGNDVLSIAADEAETTYGETE